MPYKQQDERVYFSLPLMNNNLKSQIYENLILILLEKSQSFPF